MSSEKLKWSEVVNEWYFVGWLPGCWMKFERTSSVAWKVNGLETLNDCWKGLKYRVNGNWAGLPCWMNEMWKYLKCWMKWKSSCTVGRERWRLGCSLSFPPLPPQSPPLLSIQSHSFILYLFDTHQHSPVPYPSLQPKSYRQTTTFPSTLINTHLFPFHFIPHSSHYYISSNTYTSHPLSFHFSVLSLWLELVV